MNNHPLLITKVLKLADDLFFAFICVLIGFAIKK